MRIISELDDLWNSLSLHNEAHHVQFSAYSYQRIVLNLETFRAVRIWRPCVFALWSYYLVFAPWLILGPGLGIIPAHSRRAVLRIFPRVTGGIGIISYVISFGGRFVSDAKKTIIYLLTSVDGFRRNGCGLSMGESGGSNFGMGCFTTGGRWLAHGPSYMI